MHEWIWYGVVTRSFFTIPFHAHRQAQVSSTSINFRYACTLIMLHCINFIHDKSQLPLNLVQYQRRHPIKAHPKMIFNRPELKLVLQFSHVNCIQPYPHLLNNKQLVMLNLSQMDHLVILNNYLSQMVHHPTALCIIANETMLATINITVVIIILWPE